MIECAVEGCKKESVCSHCWKCEEHHKEDIESYGAEMRGSANE